MKLQHLLKGSIIIEVIGPVLNFLFIFYDKISQVQKGTKKHQKALKSIKKYQKTTKWKKVTSFLIYKIHRHKIYQFKIYQHKIYQFKIH